MGRLTLLIGCMFAQKTTELIRRIRTYRAIKKRILVVNYTKDNRYGQNCISSHDKEKEYALNIEKLAEIDQWIRLSNYEVVAIDEAQFFPDLYEYITKWSDETPIHFIITGLDGTSDRQPFGDLLRLIPYAEEVERFTSLCSICCDGTVAIYSKYIGNQQKNPEQSVVIGGAELYQPVCRKHYLS
jgi:thymidine kinase